ncbi:KAP family NTPase [Escherichia coli]|uniref:KAP family NTPase n=1 Tax=Escherichia coli TaxID=562 RepID=UPI0020773C2E|nr:KAP family NTPase [Escherichia coli]
MTQTLNPVITVTVSGPVGSGKSYVLARIEEVVKQEFGNSVIVDAADVDGERRMSGDDLSTCVNAKIIGRFSPFLMSAIGH